MVKLQVEIETWKSEPVKAIKEDNKAQLMRYNVKKAVTENIISDDIILFSYLTTNTP